MTFAEKLKNLMNELDLTQSKLSDLTGIGKSSISQYLSGKNEQSGYKLRFIAGKLGITYQGFLKKINNESEFKASEIQILYNLLDMDEADREAIFFALNVGV